MNKIKTKKTLVRYPKTWSEIISPYIGIAGLLLAGISIFLSYFAEEKPNLTYEIIANSPLLNIKDKDFEIDYKYDSLQFTSKKDQISLIILEIKNIGSKNILIEDFDKNFPFGLNINNAKIIGKPELLTSSNFEYFKDIIRDYSQNKINFKKKIIDKEEWFKLKFYVSHIIESKAEIEPIGKITGQKSFSIIKEDDINEIIAQQEKTLFFGKITGWLSIILIFILSLLTLSLFKNNNLRAEVNQILEEENVKLKETIKELN